jgi:hypothetical protein
VKVRPADGRYDKACKGEGLWAPDLVSAGAGSGGTETLVGTSNLRTKYPPSRAKGTYFGKSGLARRSLCGKRSLVCDLQA